MPAKEFSFTVTIHKTPGLDEKGKSLVDKMLAENKPHDEIRAALEALFKENVTMKVDK